MIKTLLFVLITKLNLLYLHYTYDDESINLNHIKDYWETHQILMNNREMQLYQWRAPHLYGVAP